MGLATTTGLHCECVVHTLSRPTHTSQPSHCGGGEVYTAATEARGTEEGGAGGTRQQKPVEHGMCQLPKAVKNDLAMWPNHITESHT